MPAGVGQHEYGLFGAVIPCGRAKGRVSTSLPLSPPQVTYTKCVAFQCIFLTKTIRSWVDKIYGLVDSIGDTTELGVATFLTQNGIPIDVAIEIARWFVTLV